MSGIHPGEPEFAPWAAMPPPEFAKLVTEAAGGKATPIGVIAMDGRSGAGKTTIADRLASVLDHSAVVHTDDLSWHHSFFDWSDLMIEHVLEPVRRGETVAYRPDAWRARNRAGAIEVPAGTRWVIVEGVGAAREEAALYIDVVIWVQSDEAVARSRGIERDGGDPPAAAFWDEWMAAEVPFLAERRPWEQAHVIVNGTPGASADPASLLVSLAPGP